MLAAMIASTGLAEEYGDLVAQGYRWVKIDGPYACPTRKDLREVTRNPSKIKSLQMVERLRASFLIEGSLVKVIKEDVNGRMVQIHIAGFTNDLWTYNKFLSRRPVKDVNEVIETPATSGLVPDARSSKNANGSRKTS